MRCFLLFCCLLMILPSPVFAGRYSGIAAALNAISDGLKEQRENEEAAAQMQAAIQYQQQLNQGNIASAAAAASAAVVQSQQQLNQGNIQNQEKIFASVAYSDAETAQKAYDDFATGKQNFLGEMFSLNQIKDMSLYSLCNSLQLRQLTTVLQGSDGRYYIIMRLQ